MGLKLVNLPLIEERFRVYLSRYALVKDALLCGEFECKVFPQLWGSTALGFRSIGCDAMTKAYTTVCNLGDSTHGVFFGEQLAYVVRNPNELFFNDLKDCQMKSQYEATCYCDDDDFVLV